MDITYPSVQTPQYGSDAITLLDRNLGYTGSLGGSSSTETFSICLYTNCQPNLQMTPCDYDLVTVSNSLINTILGIPITNGVPGTVTPTEPEVPDETETPEAPDTSDTDRANALALKAEEFYASLAGSIDMEAEKALDAEFSDMYTHSSARAHGFTEEERESMLLAEYLDKSEAKANELKRSGGICIKVGAGELAAIMKSILSAKAEGTSLEEALAGFAVSDTDNNSYIREKSGNAEADLLWINPDSGEVTAALNKGRTVLENDLAALYSDDEAVLQLADDLAAFIKYAVFGVFGSTEDKDSERAEALLDHLIRKQAYADYDRYIQDLDNGVDIQAVMDIIMERLTAAGVFGGGVDDNEDNGDEDLLPLPAPEEELEEIREGLNGENFGEGDAD